MSFLTGFQKSADARTLGKIYSNFRGSRPHLSLYNSLVSQAKRYKQTIDGLERATRNFYQHGRGTADMVEAADQTRRVAHNAFISDLSSVHRNAVKRGVDTKKLEPALRDRDAASSFALDVANRFRTVK